FDEETAAAAPFQVTFKDGRWTIPSHHDYPADGKDRLAQTAAGVIGIRKDDFRTDNVADHEACGVLDPLDEGTASLMGRGKRVTLRGENDQTLADFIVGRPLDQRPGYRFVRIPDQKRVYVAKMDIDLSTRFEDWIERDLLQVSRDEIELVILKDYSIDESTRRVNQRDVVFLNKKDGTWRADRMTGAQEVDSMKMNDLLGALDDLQIVGVRPKPAGLSAKLQRAAGGMEVTQADLVSLQSRGYYFSREGTLLSNEGEIEARSSLGVLYTLRFGEIVYGSGEAVSAGSEQEATAAQGPGENRYLFITTEFDESLFPEPAAPRSFAFESKPEAEWTDDDRHNKALHDAHEEWRRKVEAGRSLSERLNQRFAAWYYVIAADGYDKLHLQRRDLVRAKAA
ncbi:MAG TPA: DUF4340 domain-containing protein, partial [Candidatus Polarisedimenticolia bacterium]|nr:DUF4340 domain-containing protein [Candidatus Polarisedimenticolia bacterium]